jgi:hypothetical protein
MKKYSFRRTSRRKQVCVSWQLSQGGENLCAGYVQRRMHEYGPCTFADWEDTGQESVAKILYHNLSDAQQAVKAKRIQIENEDSEMVPANLSWQLSAERSRE